MKTISSFIVLESRAKVKVKLWKVHAALKFWTCTASCSSNNYDYGHANRMKEPKLVFSFVPVAVLSPLSPPQVCVLSCRCLCLCVPAGLPVWRIYYSGVRWRWAVPIYQHWSRGDETRSGIIKPVPTLWALWVYFCVRVCLRVCFREKIQRKWYTMWPFVCVFNRGSWSIIEVWSISAAAFGVRLMVKWAPEALSQKE